jgi:hypothetical protein
MCCRCFVLPTHILRTRFHFAFLLSAFAAHGLRTRAAASLRVATSFLAAAGLVALAQVCLLFSFLYLGFGKGLSRSRRVVLECGMRVVVDCATAKKPPHRRGSAFKWFDDRHTWARVVGKAGAHRTAVAPLPSRAQLPALLLGGERSLGFISGAMRDADGADTAAAPRVALALALAACAVTGARLHGLLRARLDGGSACAAPVDADPGDFWR